MTRGAGWNTRHEPSSPPADLGTLHLDTVRLLFSHGLLEEARVKTRNVRELLCGLDLFVLLLPSLVEKAEHHDVDGRSPKILGPQMSGTENRFR